MLANKEKPWEVILWSEEFQQLIYREWGVYFSRKGVLDRAAKCYNKSLEFKDTDTKALLNRSFCNSAIAHTAEALLDSEKALAIDPLSAPICLQNCDAHFERNDFENCIINVQNHSRKFEGVKKRPFINRMDVIEGTYLDALGDNLTPFIYKNSKHFDVVFENLEKSKRIDERPLYKIRKELGECDVMSILEVKKKHLHPREVERRNLCHRIFKQVYMKESWLDVEFLQNLCTDKILLLPQTPKSSAILSKFVNGKYCRLFQFLKMVQSRSPLYNELYRIYKNEATEKRIKDVNLYRIQYQTRREVYNLITEVKYLRSIGDVRKMAQSIEKFMGNVFVKKTYRVMPWKFEFINEIYNRLALAYLDRIISIKELSENDYYNNLLKLLDATERDKDPALDYIFGDKSTYTEADAPDFEYIAYKKRITSFESRLLSVKFPIEKSYILHEISRNHLEQGKYDECVSVAKKTISESRRSNNYAWMMLGNIMLCKSHAIQKKYQRTKEYLANAIKVAKKIKQRKFINVFRNCNKLVNELMEEKEMRRPSG